MFFSGMFLLQLDVVAERYLLSAYYKPTYKPLKGNRRTHHQFSFRSISASKSHPKKQQEKDQFSNTDVKSNFCSEKSVMKDPDVDPTFIFTLSQNFLGTELLNTFQQMTSLCYLLYGKESTIILRLPYRCQGISVIRQNSFFSLSQTIANWQGYLSFEVQYYA